MLRPFLILLVLALAGCAGPPPAPQQFPQITFQQFGQIPLRVGSIEVVRAYQPPMAPPNVEHLFPVSPLEMAARWPLERLKAVGGPDRARYTVKRASVIEVQLPQDTGLRAAFTKQQSQRYDAVIDVELEILDERGFRQASVTAHAERSQSVREDTTLAERNKIWFDMVDAMSRDLNAELQRNVEGALGRYLAF